MPNITTAVFDVTVTKKFRPTCLLFDTFYFLARTRVYLQYRGATCIGLGTVLSYFHYIPYKPVAGAHGHPCWTENRHSEGRRCE